MWPQTPWVWPPSVLSLCTGTAITGPEAAALMNVCGRACMRGLDFAEVAHASDAQTGHHCWTGNRTQVLSSYLPNLKHEPQLKDRRELAALATGLGESGNIGLILIQH